MARYRAALLARADPAQPPAGLRPPRRAGRLRGRHVLRSLLALERAPGRVGLRLVLPRRRAGRHAPALRHRQRARAALPPGDHRAGRGHAGRDVPRAPVGGAGHRRGLQRAHHRRPVAAQGGAQRAAAGVRRGDARALRRGGGHPPRARRRGSRAAVDAARQAAGAARRGGVRGDRALGRLVGRRARHGQRAARPPARDARRLPRGRRLRPARAAGAPLVGADRGGGAAHRPRPVAHQRLRPADLLGRRDGGGVRRARARRCAPRTCGPRCSSRPTWTSTSPGCASSPTSASTTSRCTTSAQDLGPFIDAFGEHVLPALR